LNLFNIGNSIGEGIAADSAIGSTNHETVWSTGYDPADAVYSLNERFMDADPTGYDANSATRDSIFNHAIEGDEMEDFATQAEAVVAAAGATPAGTVGMVTVFLGNNNVCTDTVGTMTDLDLFEAQYRNGLDDNGTKGKQIFNSRERQTPVAFKIGADLVIPAWNIGVVGMKVGGRRRLMVPAKLGYGAGGSAEVIPPNADLIYDSELIEVR
jgi:hypothetical protein